MEEEEGEEVEAQELGEVELLPPVLPERGEEAPCEREWTC